MPLGGRTLIERVLGWLATQHIGQVVLNLHHLPESICGVVGDGTHLGSIETGVPRTVVAVETSDTSTRTRGRSRRRRQAARFAASACSSPAPPA